MPGKILIVDDAPSVRVLVRGALASAGYTVTEAVDGQDALKKCDAEKFDLIVTDQNMPNMSGIELVKALKGHAMNRFCPVLMMTMERVESRKEQAKAAGVRAWLAKPFTPERLLEAAAKLIG